jgi:hypothetical protein
MRLLSASASDLRAGPQVGEEFRVILR